MAFGASPCSHAAGEWMFEHREAVPTPLGGGTIAHSLIRPAHLAPCHDIRYSRCLPEPSAPSNPRTHLVVYTCGTRQLACFCASWSCPDTNRWWGDRSFTDPTRSPGPVPRSLPYCSWALHVCARAREPRPSARGVRATTTISISAVCGRAWRTLNQ